jgi:hypothetical protein
LGFSGSARGELEIADFIRELDISLFVYDYDHNAPDVEHLRKTHEPFFKRIREKKPDLPIIMMTRPYANYGPDEQARKEVVYQTYQNAIKNGDENVYFIDGSTLIPEDINNDAKVDGSHPTDLGFYFMSLGIGKVLEDILKK